MNFDGKGGAIGEFDVEYDHINSVVNLNDRLSEDKDKDKDKDKGENKTEDADKQLVTSTSTSSNGVSTETLAKIQADDADDFALSTTKLMPVIVNKGIFTNHSWWEKAATIFKRSGNSAHNKYKDKDKDEEEETHNPKRRRHKQKAQPAKVKKSTVAISPDDEFKDDDSDGEDGSRVLSKADKSVLPGSEIHPNRNLKKQDLSNWSDSALGISHNHYGENKDGEKGEEFVWYKLEDIHEMELFTMSVTSDPSLTNKVSFGVCVVARFAHGCGLASILTQRPNPPIPPPSHPRTISSAASSSTCTRSFPKTSPPPPSSPSSTSSPFSSSFLRGGSACIFTTWASG